ncbi:type VI secretion system tube protein TssD [Flavobacterium gelatinilyticum]|uniref:type VI secretion system tube protein TssD n=1 Tax=Flavobacterium gelatinilyticum TaxID=3003260 RepID=UPI0024802214|nr:type VI secretion system tube protein TssD [Flavobacterium gelatinilyticum]
MSFLAKLEIDNEVFNVLEFDILFSQNIDNNGKPANKTKGGQVKIVVESTHTDLFSDWMVSKNSVKDGKVIFYRRDAMSTMKSIAFKKAYCISFRKRFNSEGSVPMTTEILITSNEVKVGNTMFENNWKTI